MHVTPISLNDLYLVYFDETVTILEADYVADQVVKAILIDQETVILPEWFKYLQVLKPLLHSDTGYALHRAFKTYNSMDSFTGRK